MENEILQQILAKLNALEQGQTETNKRLDNIETDVKEVKQKVTKIEVTLENDISKNINLLVEGHDRVVERLDDLKDLSEKVISLQDDTHIHKVAIGELSKRTANR